MNTNAPFYLLAGYFGLHLFNRFVNVFVCDKDKNVHYAGSLIYVGASHLLPQSETEHKKFSLIALGTGVLVAVIIIFCKQ